MRMSGDLTMIKRQFGIVGDSACLNRSIELALLVANTDLSVLITGENGSGKEAISKIIHSFSYRKTKKFVAINCGAIPEGTVDSELFGHKKGAFTGALEDRKGYFEEADNGTIFLDEIGDLPLASQARLLRTLEDGEIMRVGTSSVKKIDTRIIAATNVDLYKAIENGRFREDLFYRLNSLTINVSPLRKRKQDIVLLFCKFASDFAEKYHAKPINLSFDAEQLLLNYSFPGNVRQLKNIVEQISLLEENRIIGKETLTHYLPQTNLIKITVDQIENSKLEIERIDFLYKAVIQMNGEIKTLKSILTHLLSAVSKETSLHDLEALDINKNEIARLLSADYPENQLQALNDISSTELKKSKDQDISFSIPKKNKSKKKLL